MRTSLIAPEDGKAAAEVMITCQISISPGMRQKHVLNGVTGTASLQTQSSPLDRKAWTGVNGGAMKSLSRIVKLGRKKKCSAAVQGTERERVSPLRRRGTHQACHVRRVPPLQTKAVLVFGIHGSRRI